MNTAHEELARIARAGAGRFAQTSLASGHASVTRRVRRHRTARAAATSVAGIGIIGGAAWGIDSYRSGEAPAPGGVVPATASASIDSSLPPTAQAAPIASTVSVSPNSSVDTVAATLAPLYGASNEEAVAAIDDAVRVAIPQAATSEGWVKPGQYNLDAGSTLAEAATALVGVRVAEFRSLGIPDDQWQTVLTKASLVEREAKLDVDKPKVARVIQNRLDQGLRLELDSTVKYISPSEGVFTTDADRATGSPYNTYLYEGLPPGAIASPTDVSVDAVLHPADGDWLFFVTVNLDTGETAYASTFPEHQQNVQKLQEWVSAQETPTP